MESVRGGEHCMCQFVEVTAARLVVGVWSLNSAAIDVTARAYYGRGVSRGFPHTPSVLASLRGYGFESRVTNFSRDWLQKRRRKKCEKKTEGEREREAQNRSETTLFYLFSSELVKNTLTSTFLQNHPHKHWLRRWWRLKQHLHHLHRK